MDKELFNQKLQSALAKAQFKFRADDLSVQEVSSDRDALGASIRIAAKVAPSLLKAFGVDIPHGATDLSASFDPPALQQRLDRIREFASTVCFKYILAQPIVVAVVEADRLSDVEAVAVARNFAEVLLDMRTLTGQLGGLQFGNKRHFATRLAVTGLLLFVYFDHARASSFIERTVKLCKITHFWEKTYVAPWVVDVTKKTVSTYSGLNLGPVLSRRQLEKEIFS